MENSINEYGNGKNFNNAKDPTEINDLSATQHQNTQTDDPAHQTAQSIQSNETTGSGFSQAEREIQDGTNSDLVHSKKELVEKYNIDDNAHRDSSATDFIPTVSNFHHADSTKSEEEANRDYLAD